eukprot:COSAG02_NODE_5680_length_4131_cov_4.013641_3_plen_74_part_00
MWTHLYGRILHSRLIVSGKGYAFAEGTAGRILLYPTAHPGLFLCMQILLTTENPAAKKLNVVLRAARFRVEQR